MSEIKIRKVNNVESFNPTEKSKKIIEDAIKTGLPKAHFYNLLIEKYGAFEVSEIEKLKV